MVAVLVAVLAFYLVLAGWRAVLLLREGSWLGVLLGFGVLLLPLVGGYVVVREVQFGLASGRLGRELEALGGWPSEDLPRAPSGRPDREAADELFRVRRVEVDAAPQDWRAWFRLSLAYDAARDRRRARQAMRRAITLHAGRGAE